MANNKNLGLSRDVNVIKKDRLRFTKNTLSSTLCYIAIFFDALYFVHIYSINPSEDIGKSFFYSITIGISVICNLLFLLFTVLSSEGVKNYSKLFSIVLIGIGAFQLVRIFGIPMTGFNTIIADDIRLIDLKSFITLIVYLVISATCCVSSGIIGLIKTITLENYKKTTGLN